MKSYVSNALRIAAVLVAVASTPLLAGCNTTGGGSIAHLGGDNGGSSRSSATNNVTQPLPPAPGPVVPVNTGAPAPVGGNTATLNNPGQTQAVDPNTGVTTIDLPAVEEFPAMETNANAGQTVNVSGATEVQSLDTAMDAGMVSETAGETVSLE